MACAGGIWWRPTDVPENRLDMACRCDSGKRPIIQMMKEGDLFDRAIFNTACQAPQGTKYTGLTYGKDTACHRCGHTHTDANQLIYESDKVNLMASKIAARAAVTQGGVMLGVLIDTAGHIAVAVSGTAQPKHDRVALAVQALYPTAEMVPVDALDPVADIAHNGCGITLEESGHCRAADDLATAVPGSCAAPKLVGYALRNDWPRPYVMSEAWSRSTQGETFKFAQSEPIESCNTCCKLLPLMLHALPIR